MPPFKPRKEMSPGERRLDLYAILTLILLMPLAVIGFTSGTGWLLSLVSILGSLVLIGLEIFRARRYGHPWLNRWIARRPERDQTRQ